MLLVVICLSITLSIIVLDKIAEEVTDIKMYRSLKDKEL